MKLSEIAVGIKEEWDERKEFNRVLREVKKDWTKLQQYSDKYGDYPDIVKAALEQDGRALEYVSEYLRNDKELVLMAVRSNGHAIQYRGKRLKADKELMIEAIKQEPGAYVHIKEYLSGDEELSLLVLKKFPYLKNSYYISYSVREEREKALKEVRRDGMRLQYNSRFNDDKELVLIAVEQNGMALQYAYYSLRKDRDVVLKALAQNYNAYEFVEEELIKNDKTVKEEVESCRKAVKNHENRVNKLKEQARKDIVTVDVSDMYGLTEEEKKEILLEGLRKSPSNVKNIDAVLELLEEKYSEFLEDSQVKYYVAEWRKEADRRSEDAERKRKEEETKLRIEEEQRSKEEEQKAKEEAEKEAREKEQRAKEEEQKAKEEAEKEAREKEQKLKEEEQKAKEEAEKEAREKEQKLKEEEKEAEEEAAKKAKESENDLFEEFNKLKYRINKKEREIAQNIIKGIVSKNGSLLGKFPDYLQNEDIVKIAVVNDWRALEFVDNKFRIPEILKIALSQTLSAELFLNDNEKLMMAEFINKIKEENREKARQEREALKTKIIENWEELKNIEAHEQDEELVMIALNQNIMAYKYVSPLILQSNTKVRIYIKEYLEEKENKAREEGLEARDKIGEIIKKDGMALQFVEENQTRKMVELAVKQNGMALQYVEPKLVDLNLAELAVKQNPKAIEFVFKFIKEGQLDFNQCRSLIFMTAKEDGHILKFLVEYVKESNGRLEIYSDIISNAVEQDGDALQYIKGENVQKYGEVLGAIKRDGFVIRHVDDRLLEESSSQYGEENLEESAVKQNGMALQFIKEPSVRIMKTAVDQNGMALQFVDFENLSNGHLENIVSRAINQNKDAAQFVTEKIKKRLSPELIEKIDKSQVEIKEKEDEQERRKVAMRLEEVRAEYEEKQEIINDNEKIISALEEKIKAVKERIGELNEIKQDIGLEK